MRKCFECGSTHLRNACPELLRTQRSSAGVKRVCVENTVNSSRFVLSPESVDSCVPVCFVDSTCDVSEMTYIVSSGTLNPTIPSL